MRTALLSLLAIVPGLGLAQEPAPIAAPQEPTPPATDPAPVSEPAPELFTFEPRADSKVGWSFVETSTWKVTGNNLIKVAGATVRKGPIDRLSSHVVDVSITEVVDGRARAMDATIREQVSRDDGDADQLDLDGLSLTIAGPSGDRRIDRVDGKRLKGKQRKWLKRQFGGSADGEDIDPISLLIPDGPVQVGETWNLSLAAIQGFFGEDRFTLDPATSYANATLVAVDELNGVETGTFSFDVVLIPTSIKSAEIKDGRMRIAGTAHLPMQGDLPYFDYDVTTEMRFLGTFIRGGIRAAVDLDMLMHGVDARRAR